MHDSGSNSDLFLKLLFFIGVELIYNVVLLYAVQQSESVHIYPLFFRFFSHIGHYSQTQTLSWYPVDC